ncbi:penicillin-binding protein activator [Pseudidiomarina sp. 1APP75-27a]|uniref:penicillin-binding protein activator n=1 Tax=Pseudidiomarina terrestris TaxID=2820060 RepID=UPI002B061B7A|nr:penicillin-binding protein activator [Pseudidiomarina sp. 1APP75-27a]MEA3587858.1 penicillin-binding protein activator [Pseudidiomarina sp. 1APP75-27a]
MSVKLVNLAIVPKKLVLCIVVCSLAACATPSRPTDDTTQSEPREPSLDEQTAAATAQSLDEILTALQQQPNQQAQWRYLLAQTERLQNEQQWQASAVLLSELERVAEQLSASQQQQLQLARLQWLASQGQPRDANDQLTQLLNATEQTATSQQARILRFARDLAAQLQHSQQAAQYQLELLALGQADTSAQQSWQYLSAATAPTQLTTRGEVARSWLALLMAAHQQADAIDSSAIQGWQLRHPEHPAAPVAERLRSQLQQAAEKHHALVLLPLSGPFAEQGQAVLDGMIMALEDQPSFSITVRDSNNFDYATLTEELQKEQADTLIGPLLKDAISAIDDAPLAAMGVRWVALNNVTELKAVQPDLWYALAPEMEIRQVAETLVERGVKHPLILAADSNRGKEAVQVFEDYFLAQQPNATVESGLYRTTDDMKAIVQQKLGVTASEARIWQVKITAGKILVDAEARSRADIDAIFLPGTIEQTRLLKPFIDVNIAPFMEPIPVFATSASHIRGDQLSENDLDNVRFTEIPWLLPNHPHYPRLGQLLQLRRHWNYNLARLAAFGHDAMMLTQRMDVMAALPGYQVSGLTGELTRQPAGIDRALAWARYDGHQIKAATATD